MGVIAPLQQRYAPVTSMRTKRLSSWTFSHTSNGSNKARSRSLSTTGGACAPCSNTASSLTETSRATIGRTQRDSSSGSLLSASPTKFGVTHVNDDLPSRMPIQCRASTAASTQACVASVSADALRTRQPLLPGNRRHSVLHGVVALDPPELIDLRVIWRNAPRQRRRCEDCLLTYLSVIGGRRCGALEGCRFAVRYAVSEVIWSSPRPEWQGPQELEESHGSVPDQASGYGRLNVKSSPS